MTTFCPNPFDWLDITAWGENIKFSLCIESWGGPRARLAELGMDEAKRLDVMSLWNSAHAREVRRNQLAGFDPMCQACPRRLAGVEPVTVRGMAEDYAEHSDGPKVLNLAYDRTCNLCCPSCRVHPIRIEPGGARYAALRQFQNNVIRPLLRTARTAFLAGLGDPFGSPLYFELLTTTQPGDAPNLGWYILTNGQGFTKKNYERIPTHSQIKAVQFSMDAASDRVYAMNRGGDWSRLMRNLAFASTLRKSGCLESLDISFVVQENNWGQITDFCDLAARFGVDRVQFNALLDQHTWPVEQYRKRAVLSPKHHLRPRVVEALELAMQRTDVRVICEMGRA